MRRERIIEVVNDMPPDMELDALFERLTFIAKVEEGLKEDDADETISNEEVKKIIDKWQ